jgi:Tfp pilus assembly protein PilN
MMYDINLIPKARKRVSGESIFITFALCLCIIAISTYFGFYLPLQQKYSLQKQITTQEMELESYANTQQIYTELSEQVDALNGEDILLNAIKSSDLKMTKLINDISENTPKGITLKSMILGDGKLTLEGLAPSYQEAAQYMVNLRGIENVQEVTILNAVKEENIGEDASQVNGTPDTDVSNKKAAKPEELHSFTLYVSLNMMDILSEFLTDQAAAETVEEGVTVTEEGVTE